MPSSLPSHPAAAPDLSTRRQRTRRRARGLRRAVAALVLVCGATLLSAWLGALLGLWGGPAYATFDHEDDGLRQRVGAAVGALCGLVLGAVGAFQTTARRR